MEQPQKSLIKRSFSALWRGVTWLRVSLANVFFVLLIILLIAALSLDRAEPIPQRAALVLAPTGRVVEQLSFVDPLTRLFESDQQDAPETLLRDIVDAIEQARNDPRIAALVLALDGLNGAGITKSKDIAAALEQFRATGKKIVAVGDSYTQDQYALATQADEIWMHPMGGVDLTGIGAYQNYFADALQKLKIDVHVFRSGTYKSAFEFLERSNMSDADRLASGQLLQEIWTAYTTLVTGRRKLPPESVDHYANDMDAIFTAHGGDAAAAALEYGLVDALKTRQQMDDALSDLVGEDEQGHFSGVDFRDYLRAVRPAFEDPAEEGKPAIAVIVASGMILDGEQPPGRIGGDSLAALIRETARDDDVKALVLRIDSPGGSAFASEIIREALLDFRASGKVYVASMGSVAASGGYWIAAPADEVWASETTITGSIGVLSAFPSFSRALEALGIHNDGIGTTAVAGSLDVSRPLSEKVHTILSLSNQHMYHRFMEIVAKGRHLKAERVAKLAEGRVWTGAQAAANGLVDQVGDFDAAIESAARLAKLEDYQTRYIENQGSWRDRILMRLSSSASGLLTHTLPEMGSLYQLTESLRTVARLNDPRGQYALCLPCAAL